MRSAVTRVISRYWRTMSGSAPMARFLGPRFSAVDRRAVHRGTEDLERLVDVLPAPGAGFENAPALAAQAVEHLGGDLPLLLDVGLVDEEKRRHVADGGLRLVGDLEALRQRLAA